MKIVIGFSGGLDSTVLLYETLRDTDHDITTVHISETVFSEYGPPMRQAHDEIVRYLQKNVREFTSIVAPETTNSVDMPLDEDELLPYLTGSEQKFHVHPWRVRRASLARATSRLRADEFWWAHNAWDLRWGVETYDRADTTWNDIIAMATRRPWWDLEYKENIPGYFQIMRRLPAELRHTVERCHRSQTPGACTPGDECFLCLAWNFYHNHCEVLADDELDTAEKELQRRATFCTHEAEADPTTYNPISLWATLASEDFERWVDGIRISA